MKNRRNRRNSRGQGRITAIDALEQRCFLSAVTAAIVPAATTSAGTLATTFQFAATDFVENPSGSTLYATVPSMSEVVAINEANLVATPIQVGTLPTGLAMSSDGSTLYVADKGSTNIDVINLANDSLSTPLSLGTGNFPTDVQIGTNNRLWVLVGNKVLQIDATTGVSTGASITTQSGDIRVTPDGKTLLAADYGGQPSAVDAFDVSGMTATKLYSTAPGSNGKDLELSADGATFALACSNGNVGGMGVSDDLYATADGSSHSNVTVGQFPYAFAFSRDSTLGYAGEDFQTPSIQVYNLKADMTGILTFGSEVGTIATTDNVTKMFSATNGELFVGEGSITEVFNQSTSTAAPKVPTITGLTPNQGPTTGGTTVTITGTNLLGATSVLFGQLNAINITVLSANEITVVTPASSVGTVAVNVTTSGGTSLNSFFNDRFTYIAAANAGPTAPIRSITLTAAHSQKASAGTPRTFSLGSFTESGASAPYTVTVNWGDQSVNTTFTTSILGAIPVKSHVYTAAGSDTITVSIVDATGIKSNSVTSAVKVAAALSPWIVVLPPAKQTVFAGVPRTFSLGSFVQSENATPFTVDVNWGDGTADTAFSMQSAGAITAQRHTYTSVGTNAPTITVTSATGTVTYTASFGVAVVPAPTVSATLSATTLKTAQSSYSFSVTYSGSVSIFTASLDTHDIFVTGPGGYLQSARLAGFTASKSGKTVTAIYRIKPIGTTFLAANNGTYHVYVRAGQVEDHDHDFVAAAILGPFKVNI